MWYLFKTRVRLLLLSVFIMVSFTIHAQQQHFIYIQADDKQPFSVKLDGKYYSSSSIGYIILPKLSDGTYNLEINFPKNSHPEQTFTVNVAGKDYGYGLKNLGDKGWGLLNFQTTAVVVSNAATPVENKQANVTTNNSAFGNMLADVINDKSINTLSAADTVTAVNKQTQTASVLPILPDTSAIVSNTKESTTTPDNTVLLKDTKDQEAEDTTAEAPGFSTTGMIKAEENEDDKGIDLTFIDFSGLHNDTIKAFIPSLEEKSLPTTKAADVNGKATEADSAKGKVNNPFFAQNNKTDSAVITTATEQPKLMEDTATTTPSTQAASAALVNSTCTNIVSDGDLNKLKKRIVAIKDQDDIILAVKKGLKNKCINTAQVKDLGYLFLNDDNRYGFYDAVYPFVYDFGNFASLDSTLIDPYYKNRFKALLR